MYIIYFCIYNRLYIPKYHLTYPMYIPLYRYGNGIAAGGFTYVSHKNIAFRCVLGMVVNALLIKHFA